MYLKEVCGGGNEDSANGSRYPSRNTAADPIAEYESFLDLKFHSPVSNSVNIGFRYVYSLDMGCRAG